MGTRGFKPAPIRRSLSVCVTGAIRSGRISGFPLDSRYHSSSGPHDRRLVSDLQFGRGGSEFRRGHPSGQQSLGDRRVQTYGNGETRNDLPALLIFDRKASGNSKPLRVIRGPKTQVAGGNKWRFHRRAGLLEAPEEIPLAFGAFSTTATFHPAGEFRLNRYPGSTSTASRSIRLTRNSWFQRATETRS